MRKVLLVLLVALTGFSFARAKVYKLTSPGGETSVVVHISRDEGITAEIYYQNREMIIFGPIGMVVNDGLWLGIHPKVKKVNLNEVNEIIYPVVQNNNAMVKNHYKEMELIFRGNFRILFRAFDDGAAYRIKTDMDGELTVIRESGSLTFPEDETIFFPTEVSMFTHSERSYDQVSLSDIDQDQFASTPFLTEREDGVSLIYTEADLEDYPGLYVFGDQANPLRFNIKHPPYVLQTRLYRDRNVKPEKVADYIAKTNGDRYFPWRSVTFAKEPKDLLGQDMVFRLAAPNRLHDTEWIRPGKVAWDWWNALNNREVSFRSGVNTDTYKYYIDFAAEYGLSYIILDEGWSTPADLFQINPDVDVPGICHYAQEHGVGVILWVLWNALDRDLDRALDQFKEWGVKGIKVDFMQRDDQWMVNYYWRVAKAAAKRKMLVDFHGAYKPCGLSRTYPNVITREGVKGLEHNKWSTDITPDHDCTLPFIRQFAGPMDYTPGAMRNAGKVNFHPVFNRPMSQGTRAHQLALYVIFESPLQMLADAPSAYYREKSSMQFLSEVPTVWDETIPLSGKVGDWVAMARRSSDTWYIGAITDWDTRGLKLNLNFLPEGTYEINVFRDGINADRYAEDLEVTTLEVHSGEILTIHMAPGGGFVGVIRQKAKG